ncbi:AraC family transcriptional regulator [Cohnella suwonensis]|uniref:AraC family transcriptional regulator n=1 Tax=Cohnella suwonensis TaxID=696072 RepID=A0ABW0LRY0_9BACL
MKLKKYDFFNFNFNVYRKILLFYFLLVIFTVLIICTTLFYLFSKSAIKEISQSSQAMLGQTSYTSELIYEKVNSLAKIMNNDPQIVDVMYATSKNPVDEFNAKVRMSNISSAYPFIRYIGVFNKVTQRYITDQGVPVFAEQDRDLIESINNGDFSNYINFMPRKSSFFINQDPNIENVLSYVICPNFYLSQEKNVYLIINVDESYIQNLIHSMISNNTDSIFVMNAQGTVLSDTDHALFMNNLHQTPYIDGILNANQNKGYFTERVGGKKQLITFVKSNTLNWYFVSVQSYDQLISNTKKLRNITFLIAIILIVVSAVFSSIFLKDLYAPVRALVERVNKSVGVKPPSRKRYNEFDVLSEAFTHTIDRANNMESSYNKTYNVFRETYLYCLMEGTFENMTIDKKTFNKIETELEWPYFCILIIKIDQYASFKLRTSNKHQLLSKYAICNISKEILETLTYCQTIDLGKDQVGVLLCLSENAFPSEFMEALKKIQNTVENLYKNSISISIGDIVNHKNQISLSYGSALEYSNYRLFLGHKSIVHYDNVKQQLERTIEYPYNIEKKILSAVESLQLSNMDEAISLFMGKISELSFQQTLFYYHQCIVSIFRYFSNLLEVNTKNGLNYYDLIKNTENLETLQEIDQFIKTFCRDICNTILESKNKSFSHKVEEVEKYMQEHYTDPNLSLESMAAFAEVSPGYFGKIFRSVKNCTFNDYLNHLRMEKARRLLIETDESIASISQKVGIYNDNYFFTLFKKTFGITPAQYRKNPEKLSSI